HNLGEAFCKLGRYPEAEQHFRSAVSLKPKYADAHGNLGTVLRWRGHLAGAENSLRRAVKLKPTHVDARSSLGLTLLTLGRTIDAKAEFEKVLRIAPRHAEALVGMAHVARAEGRFAEDEADLRFAMGKYYDDVADFEPAFRSYQRGNDLLKTITAEKYQPDTHTQLVDDLIRVYTRETISGTEGGGRASVKPIFVVGMMRSGTTLVAQILASHRAVKAAGELPFWNDAVRQHATAIRQGPPAEPLRKKLAKEYLRVLNGHSADAARIVDKAPVNSDH